MPASQAEPQRLRIRPDWTLGQLKQTFPGVELTLFAHFGVGSRERSGFAASETLADLLRRHLVFDTEKACQRLDELAAEDWANEVSASQLKGALEREVVRVIDARSAEDHARSRIAGSRLLSAESVAEARREAARPVVVVCNDGSQSPAASRHLRTFGLRAGHLTGGLRSWAIYSDESFPINYPLEEIAARWHLLADARTLRFRRDETLQGQGWRLWRRETMQRYEELGSLLTALPSLELVAATPRSFAARGEFSDLHEAIAALEAWKASPCWAGGGEEPSLEDDRERLQRVLTVEAPNILQSHKGTVEIESWEDRVLHLRLGGGCAGCASAAVTTQRELAAVLYRDVPLLDRIIGS